MVSPRSPRNVAAPLFSEHPWVTFGTSCGWTLGLRSAARDSDVSIHLPGLELLMQADPIFSTSFCLHRAVYHLLPIHKKGTKPDTSTKTPISLCECAFKKVTARSRVPLPACPAVLECNAFDFTSLSVAPVLHRPGISRDVYRLSRTLSYWRRRMFQVRDYLILQTSEAKRSSLPKKEPSAISSREIGHFFGQPL